MSPVSGGQSPALGHCLITKSVPGFVPQQGWHQSRATDNPVQPALLYQARAPASSARRGGGPGSLTDNRCGGGGGVAGADLPVWLSVKQLTVASPPLLPVAVGCFVGGRAGRLVLVTPPPPPLPLKCPLISGRCTPLAPPAPCVLLGPPVSTSGSPGPSLSPCLLKEPLDTAGETLKFHGTWLKMVAPD